MEIKKNYFLTLITMPSTVFVVALVTWVCKTLPWSDRGYADVDALLPCIFSLWRRRIVSWIGRNRVIRGSLGGARVTDRPVVSAPHSTDLIRLTILVQSVVPRPRARPSCCQLGFYACVCSLYLGHRSTSQVGESAVLWDYVTLFLLGDQLVAFTVLTLQWPLLFWLFKSRL